MDNAGDRNKIRTKPRNVRVKIDVSASVFPKKSIVLPTIRNLWGDSLKG